METVNNPSPEESSGIIYPPKPIIAENKGNNLTRSLISLFIYAFLFYIIFDQNVAYIAAVLLALLVHEFGHFFAMKLYNYQNVKLFIVPLLGAFVSGKKSTVSQKQMSVIVLAGPLPGLFIGFALYFLNKSLQIDSVKMLANVFIFLNLFNLLPIYPLDGGRFLENLFLKNNYGIRLVFTIISVLILVSIIVITGSFLMLLIPAMMVYELINENRNQKIRDFLDQEKIAYRCEYTDLPDKSYWVIRDAVLFSYQKKFAGVPPGLYRYSELEPILVQQISSILKPDFKTDLNAISKAAFLLLYIFSLIGLPVLSYILFF